MGDIDLERPVIRCPACSTEAPEDSRYCPWCATALTATETPTLTGIPDSGSRRQRSTPAAGRLVAPESLDEIRFPPGTVLAGRYRVVGLVGRGGMGEVYRADDLVLSQPVALKFLPETIDRSEERLARLLNEVRVARRVAHPHVCRVYDIGEAEGRHFLSMEYVDGEDLETLLRRIGRLSIDKAVQIARQISMGLAAAHRLGILHRDLKPSNVMIDGHGQVRITDFGIAGAAGEMRGAEIRVGTPSFMSPEQLAGKEVTVKSDLYSLGLVLYQLFTGEPAFRGRTVAEVTRLQLEAAPQIPTSVVQGLDPAIERVILRCLEKDPGRRPASAIAVAAALPGGDPLREAVAAGETPSPQLVADAGAEGGLGPAAALACLLGIVAGVIGLLFLAPRSQLSAMAPLEHSPAVLVARAREVIHALGHGDASRHSAGGFSYDAAQLRWIAERDRSPSRWETLATSEPAPTRYWYRESPRPVASPDGSFRPSYSRPAATLPGMVGVILDPRGRLRRFDAVPPELEASSGGETEPDWSVVLREAGLDPASLARVEPRWLPSVFADRRIAWERPHPDPGRPPQRFEAAALGGKIVAFRGIDPWTVPTGTEVGSAVPFSLAARMVAIVWYFGAMIVAGLVARRNLRLGRGDVKGSLRLALFILLSSMSIWLFLAHHVAGIEEVGLLTSALSQAVFTSFLVWVFYMALEPYVRRLWPTTIVSWVRLLDGRVRDPLVGRDVLIGILSGVVLAFGPRLYHVVPMWLGRPPARPDVLGWSFLEFQALNGPRETVGVLLYFLLAGMFVSLIAVVGVLLLRLLLRRQWLALATALVLLSVLFNPSAGHPLLDGLFAAAGVALLLAVLFRIGLLAGAVCVSVVGMLLGLPLTLDTGAWWFGGSLLGLVVVLGLALFGFFTSLAGRPLLTADVLH